jgi:hypothetical protein
MNFFTLVYNILLSYNFRILHICSLLTVSKAFSTSMNPMFTSLCHFLSCSRIILKVHTYVVEHLAWNSACFFLSFFPISGLILSSSILAISFGTVGSNVIALQLSHLVRSPFFWYFYYYSLLPFLRYFFLFSYHIEQSL